MTLGSLRVHAACALSPTRSPSSAWAASKSLTASRNRRSALHTVQAAEQKAAGSEPSKVNVKGQTSLQEYEGCERGCVVNKLYLFSTANLKVCKS